ncbi:MAG: glycoside hydrolase family 3 C-terminal domain-containing protein, partial [Alphaproteobacteria bacterium]|nr:glycoside hydrolase family 3 C-terminal domain-containing protein [Alphaproteobacteria bacterium]
ARKEFFSPDFERSSDGLASEYFAASDFSEAALRTSVERRFFRYMSENVPPGTPMGYRWKGFFWPRRSGKHEFSIRGRGLAGLSIDGRELITAETRAVDGNDDLTGTGSVRRIAGAELEAGRPVRFELRFAWEEKPKALQYMHLGVREPSGTITEAVEAAKSADAVLLIAGSASTTEAEGYDRKDLNLPGEQNALIEAVIGANPRTAIALNIGSPMAMPWIDRARAVLLTWLPGEEGPEALVRVALGEQSPSGRLPVTFPRALEDNPTAASYRGGPIAPYEEGLFVGYRHYDKTNVPPLFPFGHGLSYTSFAWSDLEVPANIATGEGLDASITIRNLGKRSAKEVVQLYVSPRNPKIARPPKELKGFLKLELAPGEEKTVALRLSPEAFSHYDVVKGAWSIEPGVYDIHAAASAAEIRLTKPVRVGA